MLFDRWQTMNCELMKCFFEKVQEIMTEDRVDVCNLKLNDCSGFIDFDEGKREAIMDEEKDGGPVHETKTHFHCAFSLGMLKSEELMLLEERRNPLTEIGDNIAKLQGLVEKIVNDKKKPKVQRKITKKKKRTREVMGPLRSNRVRRNKRKCWNMSRQPKKFKSKKRVCIVTRRVRCGAVLL